MTVDRSSDGAIVEVKMDADVVPEPQGAHVVCLAAAPPSDFTARRLSPLGLISIARILNIVSKTKAAKMAHV